MISSRLVVAATTACCGSRPVANAFGAGSEMTNTRGIAPVDREVLDRAPQAGCSRTLWISTAPDIDSACRSAVKYWNSA